MLRSVSRRLGEEAALLHDTGIMNTFAVAGTTTIDRHPML